MSTKSFLVCLLFAGAFNVTLLCDEPIKKHSISAQELLEDSYRLAKNILDSGYKPNVILTVWRGGAWIGIAIDEYFRYKGVFVDKHLPVKASAYDLYQLKNEVQICNLEPIAKDLKSTDRVLIVDDVVDSGSTIKKLHDELDRLCGENKPKDIRIATPYYKPSHCIHEVSEPDYLIHETSDWIVFPQGLEGLSKNAIKELKGETVYNILEETQSL